MKQINSDPYQRFEEFFENINIGLAICDVTGKFLDINPRYCKLTGYSKKELNRMTFKDITYPEDLLIELQLLEEAIRQKSYSYKIEKRYVRKDKTLIWVELCVSIIKDKKGEPIHLMGTANDITSRKQAEEKLKNSERTLQLFVRYAPAAIAMFDTDMRYIAVSQRFISDYRLIEDDLTGLSHYDVFPEIPEFIKDVHKRCLEGISEKSDEVEFFRKDGSVDWLHWEVHPWYKSNNKIGGILLFSEVITEQRMGDEKIKISEEKFSKLFQLSPSAIFLSKLSSGAIEDVNESACKITGYTRDELLGNSMAKLKIWSNSGDHENYRGLLDQNSSVVGFEASIRMKSGEVRTGVVSGLVINIRNEEYLIEIIHDITLWKLTEQDLLKEKEKAEEGQQRLKESHEIAKLGSWELDIESGIFTFTDSFYKIFHTNASEMGGYQMSVNEYASRFVHPDDSSKVAEETRKAIETRDSNFNRYVEHRIIYKDGNTGYLGVWFFVVKDKSGKTIKTYGINQDVTDRKLAELELLRAKEKAEESDRLKTAFLQNMSHEIRTPLNAIMGFSSLLVENTDDREAIKDYEVIIRKSSSDLLQIVNDILDVARIESGQMIIHNEQFSFEDLINDFISTYYKEAARIHKENIQFKANFRDLQNTFIYTDLGKLKQILANLISNAFKFTDSGEIEVGCRSVNTSTLSFYVKDTGIGIPEEKLNEIFKRFYQVDTDTSRLYGGTGIGLSIVKGLLDLLGGEIWVESIKGKGSTFTFTIPVKIISNNGKGLPGQEDCSASNPKKLDISILVVEDDEFSALYFKNILSGISNNVKYTRFGKEAIDIALIYPPDVILLDLGLPDLSGYEVAEKIKSHNPVIYIIAQTAYASSSEREKALNAGCNDFISKPINREILISKLKDCCKR